ncbi:MAG: SAM-dependent methyltransferase [Rhodocyclales bacterium]|nr:MAG: SAM-dependent methyltransferase [Rhodocyclales bacterium]
MSNERKTENLLEQAFRKKGFVDEDFQFQGADDEEIQRCLPSKRSGKDGAGKPEHIIRLNGDAADILVTECKHDKACHASAPGLNEDSNFKPTKYAEDGVLHYMKGLRKEFNVIGLAVSGTDTLQISTFKAMRGGAIERLGNAAVLSKDDYLTILRRSAGYGKKSEEEIRDFARELHDYLRDHMELSEAFKPLIVSGILLALKNQMFEQSYRAAPNKDELADALVMSIQHTLRANKVKAEKMSAMMAGYEFIRVNKSVKEYLPQTIAKIYRHLFFALQPNSSFDLLGNFYGEFLRYSGGDQQGLGIVLTPRHITELFADLADLNPEKSVVVDICAGTGGFLISAMANMIEKANNDSSVIRRIKDYGLIGIELDQHMFTLACANMIFRGDGKANMFWDDCLKPREEDTEPRIAKLKPNVAMLNPPYSKKGKGKHEFAFVKRALDLLQENGIGVAIIPVGALIEDKKEGIQIKREILESHSLKAVMSMPSQLFPGVGTVTAIAIFEAHKPHYRYEKRPALNAQGTPILDENQKPVMESVAIPKADTWFGYWRDDGFTLSKNKRIERRPGLWNVIRSEWLDAYRNQRVVPGKSCKKAVTHVDEWIAEAYMDTDYTTLSRADFEAVVKRYAMFRLLGTGYQLESENTND